MGISWGKMRNIEEEAFRLSKHERAILARDLIQSIDEEECEEENCEEVWIEEADRRYQELKEGKVKGIAEQEVLDEIGNIDHRLKNYSLRYRL